MARRTVILIGHRGACAVAPESTVASIQAALAAGVDMIELDVQMTQDRRLVIVHDERLERTTTGSGRVWAWRYRDLRRLDAGVWFARRFAGSRILLMSQALRMIPPPCLVNLELKPARRTSVMVDRLIRCLDWRHAHRRVLVSSFQCSVLARVRARRKGVARALLCRRQPWRALREAHRLGCVALHPHVSVVSGRLVEAAHRQGLRVHVWTVDEPTQARRVIRMGVDGLVTNAPHRLRALVVQATA